MSVTFKAVRNDLDEMLKKLNATKTVVFQNWAARKLPTIYGNAQRQRFMSEGGSEGKVWSPPTSPSYRKWKINRFGDWAGAGNKTQIASSRLLAGILPPDQRQGLFIGPIPEQSLTKSGRIRKNTYWAHLRANWGKEFRSVIEGSRVTYLTTLPYMREANERNDFTYFSPATRRKMRVSYMRMLTAASKVKG